MGESPERGINKSARKNRNEKIYKLLAGLFLVAILVYSFYIGQMLLGIIVAVLVLRLLLLMKQERIYFRERVENETEAGTPPDPKLKRKTRLVNILITLLVLSVVLYSYFTFQFLWGIVMGLMILLYLHMLLFTGERF